MQSNDTSELHGLSPAKGPSAYRPVISCAIDDVAIAAMAQQNRDELRCNLCEMPIEDEAPASGLLLWVRGDEVRFDEPPLCAPCASSLSVATFAMMPPDGEAD